MAPIPHALKAHERAEAILRMAITDSHQRADKFVFLGRCHTNGWGVVWVHGAKVLARFYTDSAIALFAFSNAKRGGVPN
ncbi:hypothetical protein UFOVP315_19 [uncultured Caudovirales phage]|uniref:Uncharacterized protein n=1 Tax=uncultured Caudovirales phage TaxID=2100421 RepID=A0A6J5LYW1_9CAUD|nr:hypothetical protein UFOVP315_19 [uncultured Caudovirales phage]